MMAAMFNYWMLSSRRLLLYGLLPMSIGATVGLHGWIRTSAASVFVDNLRQTEGRVIRITPEAGDLLLDVEYFNQDGVSFTRQFKADRRQEGELRAVGKISLIYDLRYPRAAELGHVVSASNERTLYAGMTAAGGLLFLAGVWVVGKRAKEILATLKLFRVGQLVQTEVRDSTLAPGRNFGRFTFAFRGPDGRWFEGKSPEMPAAKLAQWGKARKILVAYEHGNPRRSEADLFGVVEGKRRDAVQPA